MLRRATDLRHHQNGLYLYCRKLFLAAHPYCQLFLAERGISEAEAFRRGGIIPLNGVPTSIPLATQVHHRDKRRGARLLDERFWMAISPWGHDQIELNKSWARERGYLLQF
jgi:hypothetical protein